MPPNPNTAPPTTAPTSTTSRDRDPAVDDRHDELRREQPPTRDRSHEQVAQVSPRRFARDRVAGEQRHDDDEQELARDAERERRDQQPRLRAEERQARRRRRRSGWFALRTNVMMIGIAMTKPYAMYVRRRRPALKNSARTTDGGARVTGSRLGRRRVDDGGHQRSASTMPRNASSSRRRAVTVSTPISACTSAATSSAACATVDGDRQPRAARRRLG